MSPIVTRACLALSTLCLISADLAYAQDKKIYWTEAGSNKIRRANLNGSNIEDVVPAAGSGVSMLAAHEPHRQMYWTNHPSHAGKIQRATLSGGNQQDLLTLLGGPGGIAVHAQVGKIYWTDVGAKFPSVPGGIWRANLDGSNKENLLTGIGVGNAPFGIELDILGGKMYWTDYGPPPEPGAIKRADLDGSNVEDIVTAGVQNPAGIAVDSAGGKIYWTNASGLFTGSIARANLDGTGVQELVTDIAQPIGITLDLQEGKMYWVEATYGKIRRANLDGSDVEDIITSGLDTPVGSALVSTVAATGIPTLSAWGIVVLVVSFSAAGSLVLRRRWGSTQNRASVNRMVTLSVVTLLCLPEEERYVLAQPASRPVSILHVRIDSGELAASDSGTQGSLVFSHRLKIDAAKSMRLHFSFARIGGDRTSGNASFVRITSALDGAVQVLDATGLLEWGNTSAYFNGDEVLIEVVAFPGSGMNRLVIDGVAVELLGGEVCNLAPGVGGYCDGTDDRQPSNDPRVGRFRFFNRLHPPPCQETDADWCTASLIEGRPNWALTAGHCCDAVDWLNQCHLLPGGFPPTVEFNVPPSNTEGNFQYSDPRDQYPVDPTSVQWEGMAGTGGQTDGKDWCLAGLFEAYDPNSQTLRTPLQAQGASFRLASFLSGGDESALRVTGYGIDEGPLTSCGAQQTSIGPYVGYSGSQIFFRVDASAGNSGGPIEHECRGVVYGLVEAAGCAEPLIGANRGTPITYFNLRDALVPNEIDGGTREPIGVCADCNQNAIHDDLDVAPGGGSQDCNANGIPDECEFQEDCQLNSVQDICDIAAGTSRDLDGNQIPDECEGPVAPCCVSAGPCFAMRQTCCNQIGGTFVQNALDCNNFGACCASSGSCTFTDAYSCTCVMGRLFAGPDTECGVMRACCFPDTQDCIVTTQSCCYAQGGIFKLAKLTCDLTGCPAIQGPSGP